MENLVTLSKQLSKLARKLVRRATRAVYETGNTVQCPYCGWRGWRFLPAGANWRPNRLCPGCGSLERYRMLAVLLERELAGRDDVSVLEVAPKPCFEQLCRKHRWRYVSSDLANPSAMVQADLRAMPMLDQSYDALTCFHVMEHIEDDLPAYAEIGRLLKPDGIGVICVPLEGEKTREGAPRSEWTRLYGQADHVRLYGMDIVERMRSVGLRVDTVDTLRYFSEDELTRYGLRGDDRFLFVVRKGASPNGA